MWPESVDDEVDVIFAAHSHQYMNAVVDDKLLVQAYSYGNGVCRCGPGDRSADEGYRPEKGPKLSPSGRRGSDPTPRFGR